MSRRDCGITFCWSFKYGVGIGVGKTTRRKHVIIMVRGPNQAQDHDVEYNWAAQVLKSMNYIELWDAELAWNSQTRTRNLLDLDRLLRFQQANKIILTICLLYCD